MVVDILLLYKTFLFILQHYTEYLYTISFLLQFILICLFKQKKAPLLACLL